jgi:hypothetical protein
LSQEDQDPENETQDNYLTIQIPPAFNNQIQNALSASTKNVNLKNLAAISGGAWYESGHALLDMYVIFCFLCYEFMITPSPNADD